MTEPTHNDSDNGSTHDPQPPRDPLPPGQGPIDPNQAFGPPPGPGAPTPPPNAGGNPSPPPQQGYGPPPGQGPQGMPPPMMMPPPPPQFMPVPARSGGFGSAMLTAIATGVFILSLLANVVLLVLVLIFSVASASSDASRGVVRTTLVDGGRDTIAVVPVNGIITGETAQQVSHHLDLAADDPDVKAVVLSIDSPGGGVTPSDEIYHDVRKFRLDTGKPVVALMNAMAASGGYYVACGADEIIAQPTALTGSIGVLFARWDLTGFGEKYGVQDGSIVATGATYKTAGDIFTELKPEERAYLVSVIDDAFDTFKDVVTDARESALAAKNTNLEDVANGKIFSARQALALGLVDSEGYPEDAYVAAAKLAGLSGTGITVVRYDRPPTAFELLGAEGGISPGVTVDAGLLNDLSTPKLQYLWRGH